MRCSGSEGYLQLHSLSPARRLPSLEAPTRPGAAMLRACRSISRLRRILRFSPGRSILPARPGGTLPYQRSIV